MDILLVIGFEMPKYAKKTLLATVRENVAQKQLQKSQIVFPENYSFTSKPFQRTLERFQAAETRTYGNVFVKNGSNVTPSPHLIDRYSLYLKCTI